MDINIDINKNIMISDILLKKALFLYNALDDGWEIKKHNEKYTFIKKHEGKKEIFADDYIIKFIEKNFNFNKIN
jgi:hypothetical protein